MWETWVWSLDWEDLLEKGKATHSSTLTWKIPWREEPGGLSPWSRKELDTTERHHFHYAHIKGQKKIWKQCLPFPPFRSVQIRHSFLSNSLWPHESQHARPPCPSPTPRAYSNLCPLSQWCYPTISSSVIPFSSCLQSFPASGSFPMSQFFTSGGQSIWVSASASDLSMNIQDWFPLGWTGWISLQSKGLSRVFMGKGTSLECRVWVHSVVEECWSWAGKMVEPWAETKKEEEEDRLLQPLRCPA